ncbi:MAG: hypothetical protein AB2794_01090 [Candidatus Thiodiazotropha endolucinida]
MCKKELDNLKKDIEKKIDESIDYSQDENYRESFNREINKMQRPDHWPSPPEEESED